ncbi:SnoaL-like domain protein [compost metagenome]
MPEPVSGRAGARSFWHMYRETFGEIASHFDHVVTADGQAALEWTARGTGHRGQPVRYRGVSLIAFEGDRLSRFMAYFDPADLGAQLGRAIEGQQTSR